MPNYPTAGDGPVDGGPPPPVADNPDVPTPVATAATLTATDRPAATLTPGT